MIEFVLTVALWIGLIVWLPVWLPVAMLFLLAFVVGKEVMGLLFSIAILAACGVWFMTRQEPKSLPIPIGWDKDGYPIYKDNDK